MTRIAFGTSLALVLARATMLETLRDPLDVVPGAEAAPRGPGAATSLVLDLVAWLPALLVLARGAIDRTYRLKVTWAHGLIAALAAWMMLSPFWADDKFAAVVSGFHFASAAVFLWAASHLVRTWRRLRIVAAACVGLLLIFGAQALTSRYLDQPDARRSWQENRETLLRERGMEPGSPAAIQFEGKLMRGDMMGFAASPNTFAAVTAALIVIALGVIVQRVADQDGIGLMTIPVAGILLGAIILVWCDSKTAFLTPFLGAGALGLAAVGGTWLSRHARLSYVLGIACAAVAIAAVVGHGLYHGAFPNYSMTVRWQYWVGAWRLFVAHPLLGVGWDNFGQHYLAVRMPVAAEEVRDPHNFLVRFFSELGILGGVLALLWVLRLAWELTRPNTLDGREPAKATRALPVLGSIVLGAMLIHVFASVDLALLSGGSSSGSAFVVLRLMESCVGAGILLGGMWCVAVRSASESIFDDRPAPWLLYAIIAAVGIFVLHNLVDFSMFEIGPMFLFALLAGGALGMRQADETAVPVGAGRWPRTALALTCLLWLAAAVAIVGPIGLAESRADTGDEHLRRRDYARAAQSFHAAAQTVPYNADYAIREARVLQDIGSQAEARQAFDAAIRGNPSNAGYRASRAVFETRQPPRDAAQVRTHYDAALAIDPANVGMRLDYAQILEELGLPAAAAEQYEKALGYNDQLRPEEFERLPPEKVAEIHTLIARLRT